MTDKQTQARETQVKEAQTQAADLAKLQEEQRKRMAGKPTPTQAENDLAKLGVPVEEHEDDGSPEQPAQGLPLEQRDLAPAGNKPAGYQTRTPSKP